MEVKNKEKHPNADTLFVYQMNDGVSDFQIVANSENIYEVGDRAIVAKSGSHLKEGLTITKEDVRGVVSQGMALGKTNKNVGEDLTDEYCLAVYHRAWPSIESLFNVRKKSVAQNAKIVYGTKVKLDGTCASIQILPNGEILVQSRTEIITPEKDNAGFARWVKNNETIFNDLIEKQKNHVDSEPVVIHGEWCGQGVQKRCSISKIDRKVFCVFAVQYGDELDVNPNSIRRAIPEHKDIFVIPWHDCWTIDYGNVEDLQIQVDKINEKINEIEKCDPFVKETFNIEGLGEGLVFYPLPVNLEEAQRIDLPVFVHIDFYNDFVFKAKGEEHKVVANKKSVQIDPTVAAGVDEFVNLFVTENRLNQFAEKFALDMKETGNFLKAITNDVLKESTAELEAANLAWKDVVGPIGTKAREWWKQKCQTI